VAQRISNLGTARVAAMDFICGIISSMNKRAKKRLQEAIKKERLERSKPVSDRTPNSTRDPKQQTGFLPRPDKKRG
jgi:hypothetical protein